MEVEHELPPQRGRSLAEEADEQPAREERERPDGEELEGTQAMDPRPPAPSELILERGDEHGDDDQVHYRGHGLAPEQRTAEPGSEATRLFMVGRLAPPIRRVRGRDVGGSLHLAALPPLRQTGCPRRIYV